ncbi:MAG TPA: glycosyltransferase [bacterium]|nr:glycosyltransferase [bacterium]
MTNPRRRVSVVIPVFNCEAYLAEAVESVRGQAYPDLELIIVDDGSTDGTARIAEGLANDSLRYVYQDNGGPSRARNHGLTLARGDLIGFVDADDLWPPGRLHSQMRVLDHDPSVDVVLGRTQLVRQVAGAGRDARLEDCSPPFVLLSPTAALFRRRAFERVGFFDEALRYGEDTDWFMRARESGVPIVVQEDVVLRYRRHEHNMTHGRNMKELRVMDVLKRSLDRRRRHGGEAASLPSLLPGRPRPEDRTGSSGPRGDE